MITRISEAVLFRSLWLALYSFGMFIGLNVFLRLHEEPRLRRDFGKEYLDYASRVRRWV